MDCEWLGNVFTDRLLRVKARRAPSPPHASLCLYPHSVFSCQPSHCTTLQIYGCLGPPTSEGRLAARTEVTETITQGNIEQDGLLQHVPQGMTLFKVVTLLPLTWHLNIGPGGVWALIFLDLIHQHVGISGAVVALTALWFSCLGLHCLS